jgi:hypothetical protein
MNLQSFIKAISSKFEECGVVDKWFDGISEYNKIASELRKKYRKGSETCGEFWILLEFITTELEKEEKEAKASPLPKLSREGVGEFVKLMEGFKKEVEVSTRRRIEDLLSDLYCDLPKYIESDSWANFRDEVISTLTYADVKICGNETAKKIRKAIFEEHKEEIIKDLNADLLKDLETKESIIKALRNRNDRLEFHEEQY